MDNMQTQKYPGRVPDEPTIKESTWLGLAIALVIITAILFSIAAMWVALAQNSEDMVRRAQTFTPFGAVLFAMVTFCTVAWRGLVTSRQADLQAKQIEQQIRQNDAKDEENLAKLLMDGTKLVTDKDGTEATVLAGIAALQAVITAPNGRFASQAMDILGEPIQNWFQDSLGTVLSASVRAMDYGVAKGRYSKRHIYLSANESDGSVSKYHQLIAINGFEHVQYMGGIFNNEEYVLFENLKKITFQRVNFDACEEIQSSYFYECSFVNCTFSEFQRGRIWYDEVINCDFSGAKTVNANNPDAIFKGDQLKKLQGKGNYFYTNNPPEPLPGIDWSDYLEARDPL